MPPCILSGPLSRGFPSPIFRWRSFDKKLAFFADLFPPLFSLAKDIPLPKKNQYRGPRRYSQNQICVRSPLQTFSTLGPGGITELTTPPEFHLICYFRELVTFPFPPRGILAPLIFFCSRVLAPPTAFFRFFSSRNPIHNPPDVTVHHWNPSSKTYLEGFFINRNSMGFAQ